MPGRCKSGTKHKKRNNEKTNQQSITLTKEQSKTKRRKLALKLIGEALDKGRKIESSTDITRILEDYCEEYDHDPAYFECLTDKDLLDIYIDIKQSPSGLTVSDAPIPSHHTRICNGMPTPDGSRHENDKQTEEAGPTIEDESDEGAIEPLSDVGDRSRSAILEC
jgi:hypothetical protein